MPSDWHGTLLAREHVNWLAQLSPKPRRIIQGRLIGGEDTGELMGKESALIRAADFGSNRSCRVSISSQRLPEVIPVPCVGKLADGHSPWQILVQSICDDAENASNVSTTLNCISGPILGAAQVGCAR